MTPSRVVAVGYSGGRDSTALLHATSVAARQAGHAVLALHVHHGLSAEADAWMLHCETQCAVWASEGLPVRFVGCRLTSAPPRGASVEAWARTERYAALAAMASAGGATLVLLAHHRRDQAETFLLQALRGGGVEGCSAMPEERTSGAVTWARPWLDRPRQELEAYAMAHRLAWIEDDSNAQTRFDRNRLRAVVWPALLAAFPHAEGGLTNAAAWAQDASACLAELAALDLTRIVDDRGDFLIARWMALTPPRRSNALRAWLRAATGHPVASALVLRLMDELPASVVLGPARWPLEDAELRAYRGCLRWTAVDRRPPERAMARTDRLSIRRAGRYAPSGWEGVLKVERVTAGGVAFAMLGDLQLRSRLGHEQFQAGAQRPPRRLKKQYQQAAVPPWQRTGPLLYAGEQLVFVPGLGLDARVLAQPGLPQALLRWEER